MEQTDLLDSTRGGTADRAGENSGEARVRFESERRHSREQYGVPSVAFPQLEKRAEKIGQIEELPQFRAEGRT